MMVGRSLSFVIVFATIWATVVGSGTIADVSAICANATDPAETAGDVFSFWTEAVAESLPLPRALSNPNTTVVLESLAMVSDKDRCIFWFQYSREGGFTHETPHAHCHKHLLDAMKNQLHIYLRWFNLAIDTLGSSDLWATNFHFYVDLTQSHRHSPGLAQALGAPILVQSKWSGDRYSIPIPDVHMLAGQLLDLGVQLDAELYSLQTSMHQIYSPSFDIGGTPWEARRPSVVYRGCCHPTMDTRHAEPHAYLYPRADLCTAAGDAEGFDVSVSMCGLAYWCDRGSLQELCTGCQHCMQHRANVPKAVMAGYKYQVDADGFGASRDGRFWKLKSGSTLFAVMAEDENGELLRLHEQWYSPLLHDKQHLLRTSARELPQLLRWCKEHDAECRTLGEAGRRMALCEVTPHAALQYTYMVIRLMHDLFATETPDSAADGSAR